MISWQGSAHIARLVFGEGIPVVIAGLVVGTGLSLGLTRALQSQLSGVTASDAPTYVVFAAVLAIAAAGALMFPVRQARAARIAGWSP